MFKEFLLSAVVVVIFSTTVKCIGSKWYDVWVYKSTLDNQHRFREKRSGGSFSYSPPNDPSTWSRKDEACAGKKQSPINVEPRNLVDTKQESALKWSNYDRNPEKLKVECDGHTVRFTGEWKKESTPSLSGGVLKSKEYLFHELHFHWGTNNSVGSEHAIQGKKFPLEMHVIHYKKEYNSFQESLKHEDGLTVVSYLFELVKDDNKNLAKLVEQVGVVDDTYKPTSLSKPFSLASLKITFTNDYASYSGSLTTPPCSEIVRWILSSRPLGISEGQIKVFRESIVNKNGGPINNYRPLQPLNGRTLLYIY